MTPLTATEIFTNPRDLCVRILEEGKKTGGTRYGCAIFRGPKHRYKPLLSLEPCFEDRSEAVEKVKDTLRLAMNFARAEVGVTNDGCLDQIVIDQIVSRLATQMRVDTSDLLESHIAPV